jgi:hypothetical protein
MTEIQQLMQKARPEKRRMSKLSSCVPGQGRSRDISDIDPPRRLPGKSSSPYKAGSPQLRHHAAHLGPSPDSYQIALIKPAPEDQNTSS